jgi:hypothetical protein
LGIRRGVNKMTYKIGQIFEGEYTPEAAVWCNESGKAYIEEIEPQDGVRRFQIVKVPEPTDEEIAEQVRLERDRRIAETDYYMMPDYPSDPNNIEEMKVYRQALRDIPKQEGFPSKFTWPDVPKFLCEDNLDNLGLAKVGL